MAGGLLRALDQAGLSACERLGAGTFNGATTTGVTGAFDALRLRSRPTASPPAPTATAAIPTGPATVNGTLLSTVPPVAADAPCADSTRKTAATDPATATRDPSERADHTLTNRHP